jgi:hypothetical protein
MGKIVIDRGFYSEDNVNAMLGVHLKFLIGVKTSLLYVQETLDQARDEMKDFDHYYPDEDLYTCSRAIPWDYKQDRPYKGDTIEEARRMYLYLYYI